MASINLSVKLSFGSGGEAIQSLRLDPPSKQQPKESGQMLEAPYQFPFSTAPSEPTFVQSTVFNTQARS